MIPTKYGHFENQQFEDYKPRLHSKIFWCLILAEQKSDKLDGHFKKLLKEFDGLNELLLYNSKLVEIMDLLEAARIEYAEHGFKTALYRKLVLDALDVVDLV